MLKLIFHAVLRTSLQEEKNLIRANALTSQVSMTANIIGPVIGGVIYPFAGIYPTLIICVFCFSISAMTEIFLDIPFNKSSMDHKNIFKQMLTDFQECFIYLFREQKSILKIIMLFGILNIIVTPFVTIGLPYITRIILSMPAQVTGVASALVSVGYIFGSVITVVFANKLKVKFMFWLIISLGLTLIPMAMGFSIFLNNETLLLLLLIIIICLMIEQCLVSIISVVTSSAIQSNTPINMMGKVMATFMTISICAEPLGKAIYGSFFEIFKTNLNLVIIATIVIAILSAAYTKKSFVILDKNSEQK